MDNTAVAIGPRKWWVRALMMLLMALAFHLVAGVLICVALLQLILLVATGQPNDRLREFGAAIGRYLAQIAQFVSFASEAAPFPFSEWPSNAA